MKIHDLKNCIIKKRTPGTLEYEVYIQDSEGKFIAGVTFTEQPDRISNKFKNEIYKTLKAATKLK